MDRVLAEALGAALVTEGPRSPEDVWALGPELAHAASLVDTENIDLSSTRLRSLKKTILRLNRPQMHRQAAFNRSVLTAASQLTHFVAGVVAAHQQHRTAVAARLADVQVSLRGIEVDIERITATAQRERNESEARWAEIRNTQRILVESVERLRASLDDDRRPSLLDKGATDEARRRQARQDAVYERFEEAFRGDEAQIRDRVSAYLPDVEFLCALDAPVFDVGCGRGEWLALLEQEGHQAVGVDLNASMVDRCQAAGLTVVHADAIDALAARETGGLGAVTAFHVVEHMRMADLITFLEAAHRGLRPGGVLILETPNPTNLLVGAATFYRDPTHVRPLHPDLLSFLVSEAGFTDVETRFLHPVANDTWSEDPSAFNADLHWALQGPQDYAVVAHVPVA